MNLRKIFFATGISFAFWAGAVPVAGQVPVWTRFEKAFQSTSTYGNPLYDLRQFAVHFQSPSGRTRIINGFWDGDRTWKVRFCPDETGTWRYRSVCSDTLNTGLHTVAGSFECTGPEGDLPVYTKGSIIHPKGSYYLSHADGTPFFYAACTAWNGTLKSTDEEWEMYLENRMQNHYSVIQFTATQWRGGDRNSEGQVAFEGSGRISVNPSYFRHLDKKIEAVNRHGLVAAPVLLWALPVSAGRELSPGYYLPDQEAILLARYMVARYGGHHVIWILGGDGKYTGEYEQRWKNIGRAVFGEDHPGVVALHSMGRSWIGKEYANEDWLDIIGYQSGHNSRPNTIDWINKGPVAAEWAKLPPKVIINMEPCYDDRSRKPYEIRNASYWSLFSTPVAGITYGAGGIWPWIRPGEKILNHGASSTVQPWYEDIRLPAGIQVGKLAHFMRQHDWWQMKPAPELLVSRQEEAGGFISVARSDDHRTLMAYVPAGKTVKLRNPFHTDYAASWFDPETGRSVQAALSSKDGIIEAIPPKEGDAVLVLEKP